MPPPDTGTTTVAARVESGVSTLSDDDHGTEPAPKAVKKPGSLSPDVVSVTAAATASRGVLDGSGTRMRPPASIGSPLLRESSRRTGSVATKRPDLAELAGTKAPVTSMTMSAPTDEYTDSDPPVPSFTIRPFDTIWPRSKLTFDASGIGFVCSATR